ncbi:hypothetical protein [Brachybacterium sp.]
MYGARADRQGGDATAIIGGDYEKISFTGDDTAQLLGWEPL